MVWIVAAHAGTVEVTLSDVRGETGEIRCAVWSADSGFPETGFLREVVVPARTGACEMEMPDGPFAVAAFHDADGDGRLAKNLLGIPREGVAVSNNAHRTFGPPRFADCVVPAGTTKLSLGMVY